MAELAGNTGFARPKPKQTLTRRHAAAMQLITTLVLTVSLVVAATAVSIGNKSLARADLAARPATPATIILQ
ncbi:MAG: hypothetical protein KGK33_06230 [Hyphomicrobiales bacterium]|nr:hypothetical protein [Hyphomicrobiales bacterium]MDE2284195.1 hypothetical protein [Hyphomicrobiales bacterium]